MSHLFYEQAKRDRDPARMRKEGYKIISSNRNPEWYRSIFVEGSLHNIPIFDQVVHPDGTNSLSQRNLQINERQDHSWSYLYDTVLGFFRKIKGSVQPFKPCVIYLRTQTANILM